MPKNDFTASAGISLEQWEKDIARMSGDVSRITEEAGRATKSIGSFGGALKASSVAVFGAAVVSELAGVNVAVGDTSKAMASLKTSAFSDEAPEGMERIANAAMDVAEASKDAMRQIPLFGNALADVADITRKYAADELAVAVATGKEAESAEALTQKLKDLRDARTTEQAKGPGFRNEANIRRLNEEITNTSKKYVAAANAEVEAGKENSAGQTQRIALAQLEIEKKQRLASLSESLKNQLGEKGKAGGEAFTAGAQKIEREIELKRRGIELGETQEQVATNLNEHAEQLTIEYSSQLNFQKEKIAANQIEVAKAEKLFGIHSLIASQLRAQGHELFLHGQEMEYMHSAAIEQASDATSALDAQLAGNKALASIEQNRVANAQKIRDAIRQGNPALAEQFAKQQALSDLDARVKQLRRTPQQVRDDRKEQEANDRAVRHINAIEKNNPNSKPADGRNFVSPSAAKARAEIAARHAKPNIKAAEDKLQDMKVNNLIVAELKNAQ